MAIIHSMYVTQTSKTTLTEKMHAPGVELLQISSVDNFVCSCDSEDTLDPQNKQKDKKNEKNILKYLYDILRN